jgi:hypothetical protein
MARNGAEMLKKRLLLKPEGCIFTTEDYYALKWAPSQILMDS